MDIKLNPMQQKLHDLFPAEADIPADCRVLAPLHQRSILLNGEMQIWKGETRAVFSPVHVRAADGSLTPVELGSFPVTGTAEADAAIAAATQAYDNGRGRWPTMSVAERIACVENFTNQIVARRREIVNLIMWEIGKSLADSEKEFDRTIDYIKATIAELKDGGMAKILTKYNLEASAADTGAARYADQ